MGKLQDDQNGFSAVETILVIVILVLIGAVGYLVYKNHHKTPVATVTTTKVATVTKTTAPSTTTTSPYTGWKTYSVATLGTTFKYPSTWTAVQGQPQCTGAIVVTATPGSAELSSAATTINATLASYSIVFDKYGTESSNCAPDGTNFKGDKYNYLQSADAISSGVFKGDSLTFFGSTTGNKTGTLPDTGLLTDTSYTSTSPSTFVDAGTVSANSNTYQVSVYTSSVTGQQYSNPVPMNITLLKGTQLYKDTVGVIESAQ